MEGRNEGTDSNIMENLDYRTRAAKQANKMQLYPWQKRFRFVNKSFSQAWGCPS